uniref:ATP synthase complex subunit 8 n=1 Tax=Odobenus rosmarus TaxID=9707 RepID=Q679F0_9CARN|nr:ATP synthase F0 subunit 8 [Odobenus rosmarus]
MPQLDTSTWFTVIVSTILTLFIVLQLKISKHSLQTSLELKSTLPLKTNAPWDKKWTKIYLPLSLPLP